MNVEERLNAIITELQRSVPAPFDPPRDWLMRKATVMYLQELTDRSESLQAICRTLADRIESLQRALQIAGKESHDGSTP
jgi:hypothetical protein